MLDNLRLPVRPAVIEYSSSRLARVRSERLGDEMLCTEASRPHHHPIKVFDVKGTKDEET